MTTETSYLYRIRPRRPAMLTEGATPEEADIMSRHFTYLKDLTNEGVVLLAGRTLTTDSTSFGIVILRGPEEKARRVMDRDPAVAEGVMHAEFHPYRVALLAEPGAWRD